MADTMNKKGGISVETEHIFPIIKKWLYSEKEIFLREIVSNACIECEIERGHLLTLTVCGKYLKVSTSRLIKSLEGKVALTGDTGYSSFLSV